MAPETVDGAARRRIRARHGPGKWWTALCAVGYGRGMASEMVDGATRRRMRARHASPLLELLLDGAEQAAQHADLGHIGFNSAQ